MAAAGDKRRQILSAAVRVFAAQGYDASRVGDVAKEAGVAYGLVYHYFGSKEAVLEAVFREQWGRLLAAVALAEETGKTAPEQLELVVKIVLTSSVCSAVRSRGARTSTTSSTRSGRRSRASSGSSSGDSKREPSVPMSTRASRRSCSTARWRRC